MKFSPTLLFSQDFSQDFSKCDFHEKQGAKLEGGSKHLYSASAYIPEKESKDLIWHVSCKKATGEQTKMSCKNARIF